MKIVMFAANAFGMELLETLIAHKFDIAALFTMPQEWRSGGVKMKNVNYRPAADLSGMADVPVYTVDEAHRLESYEEVLRELKPDIILVLGWYSMIPEKIRAIPRLGCCGIHASLLPDYAGWAPLVWAIIHGEKKTGVTFFRMDDSVDGGDVIAQKAFDILEHDSIKEVYEKATEVSKAILLETLPKFETITPRKQDKAKLKTFPRRTPADGEIDLSKPAKEIYDFIRAQSSPYPGAFIKTADGKKLIIEKARIEDDHH